MDNKQSGADLLSSVNISGIPEIIYNASLPGLGWLSITDMNGKLIVNKKVSVQYGRNMYNMNTFVCLQPGIYIVRLNDGAGVHYCKMIVN